MGRGGVDAPAIALEYFVVCEIYGSLVGENPFFSVVIEGDTVDFAAVVKHRVPRFIEVRLGKWIRINEPDARVVFECDPGDAIFKRCEHFYFLLLHFGYYGRQVGKDARSRVKDKETVIGGDTPYFTVGIHLEIIDAV